MVVQEASPLLSLVESRQRAKELLCWSAEQRLQVHMRLCEVLDQWRTDWGLSSPAADAVANALLDAQAVHALALELFGPHVDSSAAHSIAKDAWRDWGARLDAALGEGARQRARTDRCETDRWSGYLEIHLPWWGGTWSLGLPAESVRLLLGNTQPAQKADLQGLPPIASLGSAIANEAVGLSVQFKPISLTLGQLQQLRFGDVVPIGHRLEDPIAVGVRVGDAMSQPICHAWLGQRSGGMAIELTR